MFLTGEKLIPIAIEHRIATHPEIKTALLGTGRRDAAVLIELLSPNPLSTIEKVRVIERIWPIMQDANNLSPEFARVAKDKMVVVDPEKPMERTPKGTVQREPTVTR